MLTMQKRGASRERGRHSARSWAMLVWAIPFALFGTNAIAQLNAKGQMAYPSGQLVIPDEGGSPAQGQPTVNMWPKTPPKTQPKNPNPWPAFGEETTRWKSWWGDCMQTPAGTGGYGPVGSANAIIMTWFADGAKIWPGFTSPKSTANLTVLPPDSTSEPGNPPAPTTDVPLPPPLCGPLDWAEHMFLWVTSPAENAGGARIFSSPIFFSVVPTGKNGKYTLTQNQPGVTPKLALRAGKPHSAGTPAATGAINVQQGQASGEVLMAQPKAGDKYGSLVYYEIEVNDVYAYFATAAKTPDAIAAKYRSHFPTTMDDVGAINAFASKHNLVYHKEFGRTDERTLAVEIKTAWVEADKVPTECKYITRTATVPTYNTSDSHRWTVNGEKTVNLALVGMHIAGNATGHPEMIWATFEHICNTPNAKYAYLNAGNELREQEQDTKGRWLFAASDSKGPFNRSHMQMSGDVIVARAGYEVGPSDTLRVAPWGNDAANAVRNEYLLLLNGNVEAALTRDDLRLWYVMVGSVWNSNPGGNQTGTTSLANSTMETYLQVAGTNCFLCHSGTSNRAPGTDISHIYAHVDSLLTPPGKDVGAAQAIAGQGAGALVQPATEPRANVANVASVATAPNVANVVPSLNCAAPNTQCGARCVNLAIAPMNCGTCGTVCGAGERCHEGKCVRPGP